MLVLNTVLHGVGLVVDELSGVPRNVIFEHVLALHILQLHPVKYDRLKIVTKTGRTRKSLHNCLAGFPCAGEHVYMAKPIISFFSLAKKICSKNRVRRGAEMLSADTEEWKFQKPK